MKKYKIIIFSILGIIVISSFWFSFFFLNKNINIFEKDLFEAGESSDVVIVFNSGGWGTVSLEKAKDFNPIINEIKRILEDNNYKVSIVEYHRTEENIIAKLGSLKEIIFNFSQSSNFLAEKIESFISNNPERKIIMAGLSNGASFANSVMSKIEKNMDNVFSIELGAPFANYRETNKNILELNNETDFLANGDIKELSFSVIKAPFVWLYDNIRGESISFFEAMSIKGHNYDWQEVGQEISSFIKERI